MTTAGRPTFNAAIGQKNQGGWDMPNGTRAVSAKDLRAHTKLKTRQPITVIASPSGKEKPALEDKSKVPAIEEAKAHEPVNEEEKQEEKEEIKKLPKNIDADDESSASESSSSDDDSSSDEDEEEDDTPELMKELERIKRERQQEQEQKRESQVLTNNPLLSNASSNPSGDFNVKKRWYEDTIFKNQARGEVKQQKRFINDTIRNDFHKKFLQKYIK